MLVKYYTAEQIAERYGVKLSTVWAWLRARKISAIKIGKQYRVSVDALAEFEKKNTTI